MKKITTVGFVALFISCSFLAVSQPSVQWIKDFGGTNIDRGYYMTKGPNNTFMVTGLTISEDGTIVGNHGLYDAWVANIDGSGNILWSQCYGGVQGEGANCISPAAGGGYYVMCNTLTTDSMTPGQVQGNHGGYDWWIIKIGATGNFIWGKCVGSTANDGIYGIVGTSDGGCVATGSAGQKDGDFLSGGDAQVVKLNSTGNKVWQSTYGTSGTPDIVRVPIETKDGNIMIAGETKSQVGGNHGESDFWALKVSSATGGVIWQKCFGGTKNDAAVSVVQLADESYVMCGITLSNDGDVAGQHKGGTYDGMGVHFDKDGNLIWAKTYGSTGDEELLSVTACNDGGFFFGGDTRSTDIPNCTAKGSDDMWLMKTDNSGTPLWHKQIGGGSFDYAYSVVQSNDGSFAAFGWTKSQDADLAGVALGNMDMIMVKLSSETGINEAYVNELPVTLSPNPVTNTSVLQVYNDGSSCKPYTCSIIDVLGNMVASFNFSDCKTVINKNDFSAGVYFYQITSPSESSQTIAKGKLVIQ